MSDLNQTPAGRGGNAEWNGRHDKHPPTRHGPPGPHPADRIAELETENARLHRLVAELLLKNQQLRKPD